MAEKKLNQGLNRVEIVGTLKEKNLEIKKKEDGSEYITGKLTIKSEETNEIEVSLFANKLTNEGKESSLFKGYKTILDEYVSSDEIATQELEGVVADRVQVDGEIGVNDYFGKDGLKSFSQVKGKFIKRVKPEIEDKSSFDVEMYIQSIKPEKNKEQVETGRFVVQGILPIYNEKVIPIEFVVTDEDGVADFVESNFEKGQTVNFWGKVVSAVTITSKKKKGFGKDNENINSSTKRELLITGGDEDAYEEDKAFDSALIKKALGERQIYLNELEQKSKEKGNKKESKKGFGAGKTNKPTIEVDDEDIPF